MEQDKRYKFLFYQWFKKNVKPEFCNEQFFEDTWKIISEVTDVGGTYEMSSKFCKGGKPLVFRRSGGCI